MSRACRPPTLHSSVGVHRSPILQQSVLMESEVLPAQLSHNFSIIQGCEYEIPRIIVRNPIFETSGCICGTVSADSCLSGNTVTPCKARKRRSVFYCLAVIGVHLLSNLPRMSLCKTAKKTWRKWMEGGLSHCRIKDEYKMSCVIINAFRIEPKTVG